jgi:hypothetical protein
LRPFNEARVAQVVWNLHAALTVSLIVTVHQLRR